MRLAALLACVLPLLAGCVATPPRVPQEQALLAEAIHAAGGERALRAARILAWQGDATVFAGDRRIDLGVDSEVEPFLRARSDSWLRDAGRTSLRRLEIDGSAGWSTRDGKRTPLDPAAIAHERAQFAAYGLMRLVDLRDPGVRLQALPPDAEGRRGFRVSHPQAPAADLYFDADGRLARLLDRVPTPDGKGMLDQRFEFEGRIEGDGVRWPSTLRILQDGKPYFELRLREFHARVR